MGVESAVVITSAAQLEEWLAEHGSGERELWVAILKMSTKRQTVTLEDLLDVALCYGWVDVMTKGIDEERYGIRFVPRRAGSNWSAYNRARVCRLIAEGRMRPSGAAMLPPGLACG